jgi:carboxyl-terminal processing protease
MIGIRSTIFSLLSLLLISEASIAQDTITQHDRVMTATKIYQQITTFYPELSPSQFDQDYGEYIGQILGGSDDRRNFDLVSMAFVAKLHDGHTWFYDQWFDKEYGQAVGFAAYPLRGKWVVVRSGIGALRIGDVIEAIEGTPTQQYFERSRKYISASSDRDAGVSFFDTPVLFPKSFTLTLDGARRVTIDRAHDKKEAPSTTTEGRLLANGSVAYIRVPVFRGIATQSQALDYLKQYHEAKALILDVRGNPGLGDSEVLQRSLMTKPYQSWIEHTAVKGGVLLRHHGNAYPESAQLTTADAIVNSRDAVYTGRLMLLIDRGCVCACEDFVMPFRFNKRAELVGETTAGSYSSTNFTQFENGMMLNIASVRHTFPDGSRFEGVGIAPDVEIQPTIEDLKAGRDVVLERAVSIATQTE